MTKAFKVITTKTSIPCDYDEVDRVIEGIKSGSVIKLRAGIINPSYFVAIEEDSERQQKWWEDTKYDSELRQKGIPQLNDIFTGILAGKEVKKLPGGNLGLNRGMENEKA